LAGTARQLLVLAIYLSMFVSRIFAAANHWATPDA